MSEVLHIDEQDDQRLRWLQAKLRLPSKKATAHFCIEQVFKYVQQHVPEPVEFPENPANIHNPTG